MITKQNLEESMYQAMAFAATQMPPDVRAALERALAEETEPLARQHLEVSLSNADLATAFEGYLDFIGVDAGSTDPGPYYLGSGKGFVKPLLVKRDLSLVLKPALERKIPLIMSSCCPVMSCPHPRYRVRLVLL